ncbi:MAG: PQQ-binding-like beta-propeller repeat protein [Thermoanaerobaculia bacterium]
MYRTAARILSLSLTVALGPTPLFADEVVDDWPQYRGPERDGVSRASGILDSWPEDGPAEVWRHPLGSGFSGLTVSGGGLYTMMAGDDKEYACAFDAATGEERWRVAVGNRFVSDFGDGPRSTPAVAGGLAFFLSSNGQLTALATADGGQSWSLDLKQNFGSILPQHGFSTAPMIEGDLLVIEVGGGRGKAYAALDPKDGSSRWTTLDGVPTYTSPIAVTFAGERQLISLGDHQIFSLRPGGELAWSHPWQGGIAMPIFVAPDKLFVSTGHGSMLVELAKEADGVTVSQVWQSNEMKNHFNSSVVHDGTVYGFDNAILKAVSLETGKRAWAKRGFGKGSLIVADGDLIVLGERGLLVLAEASPEGFDEKGRVRALDDKCWTSPTLAGGRLYLRSLSEMVSYDLRG